MASTIKDVSKMTGLSLATISKYLNGGNVLEENRIAIENTIEKLDFRVNEFARGLKTSKSKTIGVIIPEISNMFGTSMISIIEDILRKRGYGTIICDCHSEENLEREAISFIISKMVDGIITMPVSRTGEHLELAKRRNIPVVLLNIKYDRFDYDSVMINNVDISYQAILYLIKNGHKNIAFISGPRDILTAQERLLGYMQAHIENGMTIRDDYIVDGKYTTDNAYEAMKEVLNTHPEITAVFVTDYEMTLGAILALNELKVKIPDDISFIGFDNLRLSHIIKPKLTLVTQPIEQISENAARLILNRINNPIKAQQEICNLKAELILGDSVKSI
jgi:LacI family transcriptional regulator